MDPNYGEWNFSEIKIAKALIASHNAKSSYSSDMNNKQTDIIDMLQARFPTKEKHKVTKLYVDLMLEKMQMILSGNQHATMGKKLVNDKFGMSIEDPAIDFMGGDLVEKRTAKRKAREDMNTHLDSQKERRYRRFWTIDEHRLMISLFHTCICFALFISFVLFWKRFSHFHAHYCYIH